MMLRCVFLFLCGYDVYDVGGYVWFHGENLRMNMHFISNPNLEERYDHSELDFCLQVQRNMYIEVIFGHFVYAYLKWGIIKICICIYLCIYL